MSEKVSDDTGEISPAQIAESVPVDPRIPSETDRMIDSWELYSQLSVARENVCKAARAFAMSYGQTHPLQQLALLREMVAMLMAEDKAKAAWKSSLADSF